MTEKRMAVITQKYGNGEATERGIASRTLTGCALLILVVSAFVTLSGCSPDISETEFYKLHPDPEALNPPDVMTLGTVASGAYQIVLGARSAPYAGRNQLLFRIAKSGAQVNTAEIEIVSTRADLSAPVPSQAIEQSTADEDGWMPAHALFLQRKGADTDWRLDVTVRVEGDTLPVGFDVTVRDSLWLQEFVDGASGDVYYVTWIDPLRPETGDADFELAVFRESAGEIVGVDNGTMDLHPYMDMGAGEGHSTPYEAPTAKSGGFYRGRVNFIMSGGWDMTVFLRLPGLPEEEIIFAGFTVH